MGPFSNVAKFLKLGAAYLGAADFVQTANLGTPNNPPSLDANGVLPAIVGLRQGLAATINNVVLSDGELAIVLNDLGRPIGLRVGNGVQPGGYAMPLGSSSGGSPAAISGNGRYVFYGGSSFVSGGGNDTAIDTIKEALLPGEVASFTNYTSYDRGINGIMVDLVNTGDALAVTASDFEFRTGNTNDPTSWPVLGTAATVTVRRGEGLNGADRIEITWPDNTIRNKWLQVTVKANANTGLASPDVHYWGNSVGDTNGDGVVNNTDVFAVFNNYAPSVNVNNLYDINRDGSVSETDVGIVQSNITSAGQNLVFFTAPA